MALISVLMPVYNAAATCDAALGSLAAQTLGDFEVIAVDDGSADATPSILASWAQADPRVHPVAMPHSGLIGALNQGLRRCTGQYIARMDADDRCHPERLELQVALLAARREVSVVGCLVEAFPRENVGDGLRLYLEWLNGLVLHEDMCREIFVESPIVHPSAMVRRQEMVTLGGYVDNGWAEDYDLWLRYHAAGKRFAKVPRRLFHWREHGNRATRTDSRYSVENFLRAKAHYLLRGPLRNRDDIVIWGAGRTGRRLSKHLERGGRPPCAFVDIDPERVGRSLRRRPVVCPDDLRAIWRRLPRPILLVAVASRGARQLIRTHLTGLGLLEGRHFLCAA